MTTPCDDDESDCIEMDYGPLCMCGNDPDEEELAMNCCKCCGKLIDC